MKKIICLLLLSAIIALPCGLNAQAGLSPKSVDLKQYEKSGDKLVVRLGFNLVELNLKKRERLTLTPIIRSGEHMLRFPSFEVDGKVRHKVYQRQKHFNKNMDNNGTVMEYLPTAVPYLESVPLEDWMLTASLHLEQAGCPGCGNSNVSLPELLLANRPSLLATPLGYAYAPDPHVSFMMPEAEVKRRSQKESAYLKFPSGSASINPMFKDNGKELAKVHKLVEELIYDEYVTVYKINIQGMSSIEGSFDANMRLSERRAKSFEEYLRMRYALPAPLFSTTWMGEDWSGLRQLVEQGDLMDKGQVLDIINSTDVFEGREKRLMLLNEGGAYNYMLNNYFPLLRKVDYTIEYSVKQLNEEESDKLLKEHPSHLSPRELFMLADKFDKQSDKFKEIMDISVATYPENIAVNVNLAATYMLREKYDIADQYLKSAGNSASAFNNAGVILMMKGKITEAREVLTKAKELGAMEAEHNLKELEKLEQSAEH